MHREAVVALGGRERALRPSGSTRRRRRPSAGRAWRGRRPASRRRCRPRPAPRPRVCSRIAASALNFEIPSGTTATESSSGTGRARPASVSSSTAPSLTPGHTTIWPCTSMPWSSSARSQRRLIAPRRFRSMLAADVGVGGVDAHVQRRQPLGDHPLEVGLGEAGERGEVPVQERQAVVVVLQVQAAAHALGQLVDEAELAVVVAGAHPVEHRDSTRRRRAARRRASRPRTRARGRRAARRARPRPRRPAICHSMTSRGTSPLTRTISSPARTPARAAGEPGATATTTGASEPDGRRARCGRCRTWARQATGGARRVAWAGCHPPRADCPRRAGAARRSPRGFCAGVEMAIKALAWMVRTLRAARVLLPRDRPQPARRRPLRATRAWCSSTTSPTCPPGSPIMLSAHGSAPEVVAAARSRGPLRGRLGVPARHQGAPRGEGARRQGLPDRLRRPRRPRGGGRHDGGRARLDRPGRVGRRGRRAARRSTQPVALLAQTTLSHRDWEGVAVRVKERFPDVWTPGRSDLCFATTNRQAALHGAGPPVRRGRRDRLGQLVEHAGARAAGPRGGLRAGVPGQRRRRAARRPRRHRRRHRRRVGARRSSSSGPRPPRAAPRASSSSTSPTRTSTSRRRATSASCRASIETAATVLLGGACSTAPAMDDRSLGASDVLASLMR